MIRALILDLDNCIAAADEPGRAFFEPVFQAIREANAAGLPETALASAFEDMWRHPLDWVAERHGFSPAMLRAGWEASTELEVPGPMRGYGDLSALLDIRQYKFVVTSGFRRLQESKFLALGLHGAFEALIVDAINEPGRLGKQAWFETILAQHHLPPGRCWWWGIIRIPRSPLASGLEFLLSKPSGRACSPRPPLPSVSIPLVN
jgi:FMN phosphatase YigB (HAD superfamily)